MQWKLPRSSLGSPGTAGWSAGCALPMMGMLRPSGRSPVAACPTWPPRCCRQGSPQSCQGSPLLPRMLPWAEVAKAPHVLLPRSICCSLFFFFLLLSQGICGKMLPCLKFVAFASAAAPVGGSQLLIYAYPHRDIKNNRSVETRQWDFNSLGQGPRSVHVHLPPIYVCVFNGKVCQGVLSWFSWDSALYKYLSSHRIPNNFLEKLPLWRGSK